MKQGRLSNYRGSEANAYPPPQMTAMANVKLNQGKRAVSVDRNNPNPMN